MPHTMLRFPTVKARTSLSRSTIYLRISRGTFPAPVSLGGRAVGWIEAEVNAWLTARIAQRRLIAARGAGAPGSVCRLELKDQIEQGVASWQKRWKPGERRARRRKWWRRRESNPRPKLLGEKNLRVYPVPCWFRRPTLRTGKSAWRLDR